jgi:hypothetical protein
MVPGLYLLAGIERRWRTRAKTPYDFPHFEDTRGERAAVDKERLPCAPDLLPVRAHAEFSYSGFFFLPFTGVQRTKRGRMVSVPFHIPGRKRTCSRKVPHRMGHSGALRPVHERRQLYIVSEAGWRPAAAALQQSCSPPRTVAGAPPSCFAPPMPSAPRPSCRARTRPRVCLKPLAHWQEEFRTKPPSMADSPGQKKASA